jgi:hypothetical protein
MKKITLLLFTIGIFTAFGFTILQGGNDPVPGIDIIIKEAGTTGFTPLAGAALGAAGPIKMDKQSLKELSALADIERSVYLSKYLTPIFEKVTKEKGVEKAILNGLIETRCIECKSFEVFNFKVPSNNSKKMYSITLKTKFDTKWITAITDRDNFEKPIANPHNFELIDKVNELESKLKPEQKKELVEKFKKTDFSKLKNREEVFKTYIKYFKTPGVYVEEIVKFPPIKKKEISKKGKVLKKTKTLERQ